jgi:uncharacterized protein with ParB-like and HNH nuclease domain
MKKVQSQTQTLEEIMRSGRFEIPYNQRPYTWTKTNWELLWDAFFSESEKASFLGNVIFLSGPEQEIGVKQVFDGQQRLTTLTIMCKSLVDVLFENGNTPRAMDILRGYLTDHNNKPKLVVSKTIRKYFELNIQNSDLDYKTLDGKGKIQREIYKAYLFFKKQFKDLLEVNQNDPEIIYGEFMQRLNSLELIYMEISDVGLGIEIFESVNQRGEQLNASELVKNRLIKYAKISDKDLEEVEDRWNGINEKLKGTGFSFIDFLHYYWMTNYRGDIGKKRLFDAIIKEFSGESDEWLSFFDDLEFTANTFEEIFNSPTYQQFNINYKKAPANPKYGSEYILYLNALRFIKNKSWVMPIFSLLNYEKKLNKREESIFNKKNFLTKTLKKHFIFSFLHFNIFSFPTRDYTPAMYVLSKEINDAIKLHPQNASESNKIVFDAFKKHFDNSKCVKESIYKFKDEFNNQEFFEGIDKIKHDGKNKPLIHLLFSDIEVNIFKETRKGFDKYSIEHYMPQEAQEKWNISKDISRKHENKLGNILIIDASLNGEMQNKSHSDKLAILEKQKDNRGLTKEFIKTNKNTDGDYNFGQLTGENLKNSDFNDNPSEIDKRTKILGDYIRQTYITDFKY